MSKDNLETHKSKEELVSLEQVPNLENLEEIKSEDELEDQLTEEEKMKQVEYEEKLNKKILKDYEIDFNKLDSMSDDEAILELDKMTGKNDELIEKDYLSSLINQKDRMVYYEVENIYNNPQKKTFQNRFKMRKNPPILVIKDDVGNEAKFFLTENLTDELSETLRQVKRAYYGFHKPSDMYVPEKFHEKIRYYIKNNPFKILSSIFLILFLLTLLTK